MAIDSVKLVNYLAYDVPHRQIAAALGLTDGRVSQLSAEPKVTELVLARKAEISIADAEKMATLADARSALLKNIVDLAGESESLGEAVRAYQILDQMASAEAVKDPALEQKGSRPDKVIVQIPIFVSQALSIEKNSANEIIEVAGRSMATLPTKETYQLLQDVAKENNIIDGEHF